MPAAGARLRGFWRRWVPGPLLAVLLAACGSGDDPAPQARGSADPGPALLSSLPVPSEEWALEDYRRGIELVSELSAQDPETLPRFSHPEDGPVLRQLFRLLEPKLYGRMCAAPVSGDPQAADIERAQECSVLAGLLVVPYTNAAPERYGEEMVAGAAGTFGLYADLYLELMLGAEFSRAQSDELRSTAAGDLPDWYSEDQLRRLLAESDATDAAMESQAEEIRKQTEALFTGWLVMVGDESLLPAHDQQHLLLSFRITIETAERSKRRENRMEDRVAAPLLRQSACGPIEQALASSSRTTIRDELSRIASLAACS